MWGIEAGQTPEGEIIPGAREEARRLQALIDQGIDPRQHKADKKAAVEAKKAAAVAEAEAATEQSRRLSVTVGEAWNKYIEARSPHWGAHSLKAHQKLTAPGGELRKRGRTGHETTVAGPLVPLLPVPLVELDGDRVAEWLKGEAVARPSWSALAYRCLKAFLKWCAETREFSGTVHADACAAKATKAVLPN